MRNKCADSNERRIDTRDRQPSERENATAATNHKPGDRARIPTTTASYGR